MAIPFRLRKIPKVDDLTKLKNVHYERIGVYLCLTTFYSTELTMQQIAVLGAAFDPPTKGHADVINQCLKQFDEVWLVPSYQHAFAKKMSGYERRVKMTELFIHDLADKRIKLEASEHLIKNNGPVYSYDLMHYLREKHEDCELRLILGPDNKAVLNKFYEHEKLTREFSPFIVKEQVHIRSTDVRAAIKNHQSADDLLTPSVLAFIKAQKLYA